MPVSVSRASAKPGVAARFPKSARRGGRNRAAPGPTPSGGAAAHAEAQGAGGAETAEHAGGGGCDAAFHYVI